MKNNFDVIIIGAGLSGLACALEAAKGGCSTLLLDKQSMPARKFLYSSMGKAAISNAEVDFSRFHGRDARFVSDALEAFDTSDFETTNELAFSQHEFYGLILCNDGPEAVIAALTEAYLDAGGEISIDTHVDQVRAGFEVVLDSHDTVTCDRLVLACGGPNLPQLGGTLLGTDASEKLGHNVAAPKPGQVGIVPEEDWPAAAAGLWMDVKLKVFDGSRVVAETGGSVLFTRAGITGQAMLSVSDHVTAMLREEKQPRLEINFFPEMTKPEVAELMFRAFGQRTKERAVEALDVIFPAVIGGSFLKSLRLKPSARVMQMDEVQREKLVENLVASELTVIDTLGLMAAETFSGGVPVREVNPRTFKSKVTDGLYIVGSLLDINADWGGFAQHFAMGSGILAGQSLAAESKSR